MVVRSPMFGSDASLTVPLLDITLMPMTGSASLRVSWFSPPGLDLAGSGGAVGVLRICS